MIEIIYLTVFITVFFLARKKTRSLPAIVGISILITVVLGLLLLKPEISKEDDVSYPGASILWEIGGWEHTTGNE